MNNMQSCNVMEKVDSSGEVSNWETLHSDILAIIFSKLNVLDITMGVSRVCTSWFLASHNKTLWNTVDLSKLERRKPKIDYYRWFKLQPIESYIHRIDVQVEEEEGLSFRNLLNKIFKFFDQGVSFLTLMNLMNDITKLSRMAPKNLFFHFNSYIETDDLMFVAERMPNIEKLVLPLWCYKTKKSFQFAFSQWKNLKTLIIAQDDQLFTGTFEFQTVGENCSNLINFKYLGYLQDNDAEQIVLYLQNLKKLSLQCSSLRTTGVLLLITGLQKLMILNLSHCIYLDMDPTVSDDNSVQAPTHKLEKLIQCNVDCMICKDQNRYSCSYLSDNWCYDEIKEFEF